MKPELYDIRGKLDSHSIRLLSGLKIRAGYPLNDGIFTEEIPMSAEAREKIKRHIQWTWFASRMWDDQNTDAKYGRFLFDDQRPFLFTRQELAEPIVKRDPPVGYLSPLEIDLSDTIIQFYRTLLPTICPEGETPSDYGEIAKRDVDNILILYERICGLGPYVAESKIRKEPYITHLVDPVDIRERLINTKREAEVINFAITTAERYKLIDPELNPKITSQFMRDTFRKIIELTLDVEVAYIQKSKKVESRIPVGWGQEPVKTAGTSKGFGSQ